MSVPIGRFGPVTGRSFVTRGSSGLGSNDEFGGHTESLSSSPLSMACACWQA